MSQPGHGVRRATLLCGSALCRAKAGSASARSNLDHLCAAVSRGFLCRSYDTVSCLRFFYSVYEGYPYLLAEMYAYSMAAAHDNLPHLQVENYMVSNTESSGEGWPLVDALEDACVPPDEGSWKTPVCIFLLAAFHHCNHNCSMFYASTTVHRLYDSG